jgi:hypothetical protein
MIVFKDGDISSLTRVWIEQDGTPAIVEFVVLGLKCVIGLVEKIKIDPPEELKSNVIIFDLSLEKPVGSKGIS